MKACKFCKHLVGEKPVGEFCSKRCRQNYLDRALRGMSRKKRWEFENSFAGHDRECRVCDSTFFAMNGRVYCSIECHAAYKGRKKEAKRRRKSKSRSDRWMTENSSGEHNRSCVVCSATYFSKRFRRFCSVECGSEFRQIPVYTRVCRSCSKTFCTSTNRVHCSTKCKEENRCTNRFVLLLRDNFSCVYCGVNSESGDTLHIDHVIPKSIGGPDNVSNLVTACEKCNLEKHAMIMPDIVADRILDIVATRNAKSGLSPNSKVKDYS